MGVLSNPFVEDVARPLLRQWYRRQTPRVLSAEQRAFWDANGFVVLPGHFSREQIDAVNGNIDRLGRIAHPRRETVVDIFIGTPREKRTRLSEAQLEARLTPHKLNDLYLESDVIRRIVLEERLASVLEEVLEGPQLFCNALNVGPDRFSAITPTGSTSATVGLYLAPRGSRSTTDGPTRVRCDRTRAATSSTVPVFDRHARRGQRRDAALLRIHAARVWSGAGPRPKRSCRRLAVSSSGTASFITAASRSRIRR